MFQKFSILRQRKEIWAINSVIGEEPKKVGEGSLNESSVSLDDVFTERI